MIVSRELSVNGNSSKIYLFVYLLKYFQYVSSSNIFIELCKRTDRNVKTK